MTVELIAAVLPGWEELRGGALNASGARCVDLQIVIIVIYTLVAAWGAGRAVGGAARNLDTFWRGHAFCMMEKP
jgi:hypothetical protein